MALDPTRPSGAATGPPDVPLVGDSPVDVHPGLFIAYGGYTVLVSRHDGSFDGHADEGLYDYDTRILSRYRLLVDGQEPKSVAEGTPLHDRWVGHLRIDRGQRTPEGPRLPEDALEVTILRRVGEGMAERLIVANHSMAPYEGRLEIELDADFADTQEASERRQHGRLRRDVTDGITFDYLATHEGREFHRAMRVVVDEADTPAGVSERGIRFDLRLPPRGTWSAALSFQSLVDDTWRCPPPAADRDGNWHESPRDRERDAWRRRRTHLEAHHHLLAPAFERAADDLFALRNWEIDVAGDGWIPHAGVPKYTGLFGRDTLTAAWQALLLGPEMARGALEVIARTQAEGDDAFRDEEPGKMIHEIRRGPLAELGITPHRAYYGSHTAPALFAVLLSEYWHWTGDTDALRRYRDSAVRAFDWVRRYGDRDGDGFMEYQTRSEEGLRNQGWKDSDEGIRHADGSLAEVPIATVEEQAFLALATERMAEVMLALGDDEEAARFVGDARDFRRRWHDAFWMPDEEFYAMALDGRKEQVRSIGSNPGHALAAGLVPEEHARAVADRLMAPDMFSGWGIRTLSSEHPSFNPYGYHLGPVWPVENATIGLGFKRYGLDEHVERLFAALLSAAGNFHGFRLPEALGGHQRRHASIPTIYPNSCSPQAWSASATIQLLQIMLGIYPFAPAGLLALVRPRLPDWLESVILRGIRIGDATVSLRFERRADGSAAVEELEREGRLTVLEVPPPNDVGERSSPLSARLANWLLSNAPGNTASSARLALGRLDDWATD